MKNYIKYYYWIYGLDNPIVIKESAPWTSESNRLSIGKTKALETIKKGLILQKKDILRIYPPNRIKYIEIESI